MHMPFIAAALHRWLQKRVYQRRGPDFVVGAASAGGPYLRRWYLLPRNPIFNVYLHQFLRDDDDRALHDHSWPWASLLLSGEYIEHTIAAGGIHRRQVRSAGSLKLSLPSRAHRIELRDAWPHPAFGKQPCWTLFVTGPRVRAWGFHCAQRGWVPWQRFTAEGKPGETGKGCDA